MDIKAEYSKRYPLLKEAAKLLADDLEHILEGIPRIDSIKARAKSIDRYVEKANLTKDGIKKYENPLQDIQDQIAARVIVFYNDDLKAIEEEILKFYPIVENRRSEDPDPEHFGYQAQHFVCFIPPEIKAKVSLPDGFDFFELQVSTLFQHAWAEANHDLGYKSDVPLEYEAKRMIAWAAAQAWGADKVFNDLWMIMRSSN